MNVTLGVPRIKEIINASKVINTPIITARLANDTSEAVARIVKGRIETTRLGDIAEYIDEVVSPSRCYIQVRIDMEAVSALQLEVTCDSICEAVIKAPKLKIHRNAVRRITDSTFRVDVFSDTHDKAFYILQLYKRALPNVVIKGRRGIERG